MTSPSVLALLAALGFGVAGIFLRRALRSASPLGAALVSVTFTTAFVCMLTVATAPLARLLTWRIAPFAVAGLIAPGLARLAYFTGVNRVGVARAMPLVSSSPVFAVLIAIAALGERPTALLLLAVACITAGGALVASPDRASGPWNPLDLVFPLLAAVGFALRDNIFRYGFREFDEPLLAASVAALASVVVMGLVGALGRGGDRIRVSRRALALLAASGLSEALAYVTALRAFKVGDVSIVSPLVNTHGLFAVLLAAVFLRDLERVTWRLVLASLLILAGVMVVMRAGAG
jgi:DME family drug/metabolite transporter